MSEVHKDLLKELRALSDKEITILYLLSSGRWIDSIELLKAFIGRYGEDFPGVHMWFLIRIGYVEEKWEEEGGRTFVFYRISVDPEAVKKVAKERGLDC